MHRLCWICFPSRVESYLVGALGSPQRTEGLSQGSHGAGNATTTHSSPRQSSQDLSVPAQLGRGRLSGHPGHQAVPTVTETCLDVAPGAKLWVEPLCCFHTGSQKSPKDEDCGHCLPGLALKAAKRWGFCTLQLLSHPSLSFLSPTMGKQGTAPYVTSHTEIITYSHFSETDIWLRANTKKRKSPG